MACTHVSSCPLYAMFKLQAIAGVWRATYCDTDRHPQCARFILSAAGRPVPAELLPNGKSLPIPKR